MHKKDMIRCFIILVIGFCLSTANAQAVSLLPTLPTQSNNVVITYDALQGNGALNGQSIVYAHAGVINNLSTSATNWRYVQGNWRIDDSRVRMTSMGNNTFQLSVNNTNFYGVPSSERVQKSSFGFRNADGSKVCGNSDGSNIFIALSDGKYVLLTDVRLEKPNIQVLTGGTNFSEANKDVLVFPNPTENIIQLKSPTLITNFELTDLVGRIITMGEIGVSDTISIGHLSNCSYMLKLNSSKESVIKNNSI